MMRRIAVLVFVASAATARGQVTFVQKFYDWYVRHGTVMDSVVDHRSSLLSPKLLAALKADRAVAAKNPNEVVGLDFDPFVGSQDPCERYVVGKLDGDRISVYGICDGKKDSTADVVVQVAPKGNSWVFVNFYYPDKTNLLTILTSPEEKR